MEEGFIKFSNNELLVVAVGLDENEKINNDFINAKISSLETDLEAASENLKSKIQNKIDSLKLLLN